MSTNNFLPCFLTCWCLMATQIRRYLQASFWVLYFFNIPWNTVSFDLRLNQSHTGCGSLHNSERFKLKVQGFCRTVFHWVFCTVCLEYTLIDVTCFTMAVVLEINLWVKTIPLLSYNLFWTVLKTENDLNPHLHYTKLPLGGATSPCYKAWSSACCPGSTHLHLPSWCSRERRVTTLLLTSGDAWHN